MNLGNNELKSKIQAEILAYAYVEDNQITNIFIKQVAETKSRDKLTTVNEEINEQNISIPVICQQVQSEIYPMEDPQDEEKQVTPDAIG